MYSENQINNIIEIASSTGATFVELFYEFKTIVSIEQENFGNQRAKTLIIEGVALRAKSQDIEVNYTSNKVEYNHLKVLADKIAMRFSEERVKEIEMVKCEALTIDKCTLIKSTVRTSTELKQLLGNSQLLNESLTHVVNTGKVEHQEILVANSEGTIARDSRSFYELSSIVSVELKGKKYVGMSTVLDSSMSSINEVCFLTVINEALRKAKLKSEATTIKSKKMDVILNAGTAGTLFHEICGHLLEADKAASEGSILGSLRGEKVSTSQLTYIDDGTIKDLPGSSYIDDEGNLKRKNVLIGSGVVEGFLHDYKSSRKSKNMNSNGCARRESYKHKPSPRMSNTYVQNGDVDPKVIFKKVNKGLFIKSIRSGNVNSMTGKFTFSVEEAYLIRRGKLTKPVKNIMIHGRCLETLDNIDLIGNDLAFTNRKCRSNSGAINVSIGQPTISLKNMSVFTVGGE